MKKLLVVAVACVALASVPVVGQVGQSGQGAPAAPAVSTLKVGDMAPAFSLMGTDGKTHSLAGYKGKHIVLAWFPKAMTTGCTQECKSITENGEVLKGFDVAYFMASVDTPELNKQFADRDLANFPLLSDFWPHGEVARRYGVLAEVSGRPDRSIFVIDASGILRYIDVHELREVPDMSEIAEELEKAV